MLYMYITECESDIVEEIETRLTESDKASAVTLALERHHRLRHLCLIKSLLTQ